MFAKNGFDRSHEARLLVFLKARCATHNCVNLLLADNGEESCGRIT